MVDKIFNFAVWIAIIGSVLLGIFLTAGILNKLLAWLWF